MGAYYDDFWGEHDRDDTKCEDCGVLASDAEAFHIHHEDGMSFHDEMDNLVPLCAPCHYERHRHMETVTDADSWKEAFEDELLA